MGVARRVKQFFEACNYIFPLYKLTINKTKEIELFGLKLVQLSSVLSYRTSDVKIVVKTEKSKFCLFLSKNGCLWVGVHYEKAMVHGVSTRPSTFIFCFCFEYTNLRERSLELPGEQPKYKNCLFTQF